MEAFFLNEGCGKPFVISLEPPEDGQNFLLADVKKKL